MAWRDSHAYWENLAQQRRERFARRLRFAIFPKNARLRLDANGRPLPCSNCGIVTRQSAFEVFCVFCIATFEYRRKREAEEPEWQKRFCLADSTLPWLVECDRCCVELTDDDGPTWCQDCIGYFGRAGVQLTLDFNPERSAQPRAD